MNSIPVPQLNSHRHNQKTVRFESPRAQVQQVQQHPPAQSTQPEQHQQIADQHEPHQQNAPTQSVKSKPNNVRTLRARRSIFNTDDDAFTTLMLSLATPSDSTIRNSISQTSHDASTSRFPNRRNLANKRSSITPPSSMSPEPSTPPEKSIPWVIRTHTVEIIRTPGETLGMVIYSEKGKYGTRIDRAKPNSVSERAGLRAEDIFVRLNGEVVLHCNHQQLVRKLVTMPLCFSAEVCESTQLPSIKGKYSIEVWREGCRQRTDDRISNANTTRHTTMSSQPEFKTRTDTSNGSSSSRRVPGKSVLSPTQAEDDEGAMILFSDSSDDDIDFDTETSRSAATLDLDSW
eukprot:m.193626 g.193626  ORF g.193626 m.193626 type:complete len:346 (-) comp32510_c0_seq2:95-1132(-)